MEYFYHYTTTKNWERIQREGLRPGRSIMGKTRVKSDLAYKPAIFGLHEPLPESWLKNDEAFTLLLRNIISNSPGDLVLLKVRIKPDDDVRVGDYEHIWKWFKASPLEMFKHGNGHDKYCKSVDKLEDKFNIASKKLPEILCFNRIPAERIEFIEKIPAKTFADVRTYLAGKRGNTPPSSPKPPAF